MRPVCKRGARYWILDDWTDSCPPGTRIDTAEDCEVGLRSLGFNASAPAGAGRSDVRAPPGCSGPTMHFNGGPCCRGRKDLAPICLKSHTSLTIGGGASDCPVAQITDAGECETALKSLGYDTASMVVGIYGQAPKGCSAGASMVFNESPCCAGSPSLAPVCRSMRGIAGDYYLGSMGERGCPRDAAIQTSEECEKALNYLGHNTTDKVVGEDSTIPQWCTGPKMHFNPSSCCPANPQLAPVCRQGSGAYTLLDAGAVACPVAGVARRGCRGPGPSPSVPV